MQKLSTKFNTYLGLKIKKKNSSKNGLYIRNLPQHDKTQLPRNLYVAQEATVRTLNGTTDGFKIETGVRQGCLLSPCLFNLYAEHIMRNVQLDKLQAGIKIGRRNINNLRYADDTTLTAESKEDLKSLLMRVKEESERAGLKLNIKKKKKKTKIKN